MLRRFLLCCLLVFAVPTIVGAQQAPVKPVTEDVLDKKLKDLSASLTESLTKAFEDNLTPLKNSVAKIDKDLKALETDVGNIHTQIGDLKKEYDGKIANLERNLHDRLAKEEEILEAISKKDGEGRIIPRLDATRTSRQFNEEFGGAVHDSLKHEGTFAIENRTATYQRIFVNRTEYSFSPGEKRALSVPVGTVTTQLPGQNLVNWTVGPPDYNESIEIVPTSRRTVVYPPPVYVYPPLYYFYDYYYPTYVSY